MTGNTVRLVNGGTVQVRTGVIQGIGAQGPRGPSGLQGIQGDQGPQGDPGPMGQVQKLSSYTAIGANNAIAASTDTVISFGGGGGYDDLNCISSVANVTLPSIGVQADYLLAVWLRFDAAGSNNRQVWFQTGSTTIARTSRAAVSGSATWVDLTFMFRANGGEVINVHAQSDAATGISQGVWTITRIGSGPPGPQGPAGIKGDTGATGAQGPKGDPGSANAGFTHYSDLLPH